MTASTRTRTREGTDTADDAPLKKRKVEEEQDVLAQATPEIGERDKQLWFDEGNVILAAKGKSFKVHSDVLVRHSDVFKQLLEESALAQLAEGLEGCPILRVDDEGTDLGDLLNIIYDGGKR